MLLGSETSHECGEALEGDRQGAADGSMCQGTLHDQQSVAEETTLDSPCQWSLLVPSMVGSKGGSDRANNPRQALAGPIRSRGGVQRNASMLRRFIQILPKKRSVANQLMGMCY